VAATALYRKWRPKRFADIVGQDPIVQTLRNAVLQDKIAHAYLFSGPRGTGKTSTGRILAKAINLPHDADGEPETDSPIARQFDDGRHLDLIEIDAASNRGIDDIRSLRERANYVPTSARFKVYLIDEAHQLTSAAEDALLKTLEEPPPHVVFILATTEPENLKPTILSRCQRFDFRRVSVADLVGLLRHIAGAEGITAPDEALQLLAREATGSARDAVQLLDQVWATHGDTLTLDDVTAGLGLSSDARALELARAALAKDLKAGLTVIAAVQDDAVELGRFNKQVVLHLRHALLLQSGAAQSLALSEPEQVALKELAGIGSPQDTAAALRAFGSADLRTDPFTALPLELALTGLVYAPKVEAAPTPQKPSGQKSAPSRRDAPQRRTDEPAPTFRTPPPVRSTQPPQQAQEPAAAPRQKTAPREKVPAREPTPEEQLLIDVRAALKEMGGREPVMLAGVLNGSCTASLQDDTLTLIFPLPIGFHKEKIDEQSELVARAATQALGRPITLVTTAADEKPAQRSKLAAAAEAEGLKRVAARSD